MATQGLVIQTSQASPKVQRLQDLHNALALVTVNAQAIAAADLCLGTLIAVRDRFSSYSVDNARRWAAERLDGAIEDVRRYRKPFEGMPAAPISEPSWDDLNHAIKRGMNLFWALQDGPIGTDTTEWQTLVDYAIDVAVGTIQAMPGVIRDAVRFTSELATDTVGSVAAGLLPLWPLVMAAGAIAVVAVLVTAYGRKKGVLA